MNTLPKLITFDCYGTLIDWHGGLCGALRTVGVPDRDLDLLAERYVRIEAEVEAGPYVSYRKVMASALARTLEEGGYTLPAPSRDILADFLPGWRPFPEVPAALRELAGRAPLAILSNIDDDLLDASIARLGVPIAHRVTAESVRSYKPAHAHFLRIQEQTGVAAGDILHVAASVLHDHEPCRDLGIPSVWINRRREARPEWLPAERVLADLRRVPELAFGL